jgi:hypothetical protein
MMAKGTDQEKKSEDPKGEFPEAHKEVIYIYGGLESHQSRRKQKLTVQEVVVASPTALSTLNGQRSPLPSTTVTTQTLCQSRCGIFL